MVERLRETLGALGGRLYGVILAVFVEQVVKLQLHRAFAFQHLAAQLERPVGDDAVHFGRGVARATLHFELGLGRPVPPFVACHEVDAIVGECLVAQRGRHEALSTQGVASREAHLHFFAGERDGGALGEVEPLAEVGVGHGGVIVCRKETIIVVKATLQGVLYADEVAYALFIAHAALHLPAVVHIGRFLAVGSGRGVVEIHICAWVLVSLILHAHQKVALLLCLVQSEAQADVVGVGVFQQGVALYDEERIGVVGVVHRLEQVGGIGVVAVGQFGRLAASDFPSGRHIGLPQVDVAPFVDVEAAAHVIKVFVSVAIVQSRHQADFAHVERHSQCGAMRAGGLPAAIAVGVGERVVEGGSRRVGHGVVLAVEVTIVLEGIVGFYHQCLAQPRLIRRGGLGHKRVSRLIVGLIPQFVGDVAGVITQVACGLPLCFGIGVADVAAYFQTGVVRQQTFQTHMGVGLHLFRQSGRAIERARHQGVVVVRWRVGGKGGVERVVGIGVRIVGIDTVALCHVFEIFVIVPSTARIEPGDAVELKFASEREVGLHLVGIGLSVRQAEGAAPVGHKRLLAFTASAPAVGVVALYVEREVVLQLFLALAGVPLVLIARRAELLAAVWP